MARFGRLLRGRLWSLSLFFSIPLLPVVSVHPQDGLRLHGRITGRVYQDDKIRVEVPAYWTMSLDQIRFGGVQGGAYEGVILRRGNYVLRLCSACEQSSGISGGRFGEVANMVQPWFRVDATGLAMPCGERRTSKASKELERVDFWFRRDPGHLYSEIDNDCRQPQTSDTVWYGSYFSEHCPQSGKENNCGGYFLHHDWLTKKRTSGLDEMVFAMTYDTQNLNDLPREGDAHLQEILREASEIVRSVHFSKSE